MEGTTDIQVRAKHKRSRAIPKGRFRERAFRYMNDTVVLWNLRTVLDPSLPQQSQVAQEDRTTPSTTATKENNNQAPSASVSSVAFAQYQNDLKVKEEILRRSRKNNQSSSVSKTKLHRNYRVANKRFRSVMENFYRQSLS